MKNPLYLKSVICKEHCSWNYGFARRGKIFLEKLVLSSEIWKTMSPKFHTEMKNWVEIQQTIVCIKNNEKILF